MLEVVFEWCPLEVDTETSAVSHVHANVTEMFSISMVIETMEAGYILFLLYWRSICFNYLCELS